MTGDDIQRLHRILGDLVQVTGESLQKHLQAYHRHPLQRHLKGLVLPLTWQSDLEVHLRHKGGERCYLSMC